MAASCHTLGVLRLVRSDTTHVDSPLSFFTSKPWFEYARAIEAFCVVLRSHCTIRAHSWWLETSRLQLPDIGSVEECNRRSYNGREQPFPRLHITSPSDPVMGSFP